MCHDRHWSRSNRHTMICHTCRENNPINHRHNRQTNTNTNEFVRDDFAKWRVDGERRCRQRQSRLRCCYAATVRQRTSWHIQSCIWNLFDFDFDLLNRNYKNFSKINIPQWLDLRLECRDRRLWIHSFDCTTIRFRRFQTINLFYPLWWTHNSSRPSTRAKINFKNKTIPFA